MMKTCNRMEIEAMPSHKTVYGFRFEFGPYTLRPYGRNRLKRASDNPGGLGYLGFRVSVKLENRNGKGSSDNHDQG